MVAVYQLAVVLMMASTLVLAERPKRIIGDCEHMLMVTRQGYCMDYIDPNWSSQEEGNGVGAGAKIWNEFKMTPDHVVLTDPRLSARLRSCCDRACTFGELRELC